MRDLDAALRQAQALGSEVLFPKTPTGSGWQVAEIRDSEGNRIALQARTAAPKAPGLG